ADTINNLAFLYYNLDLDDKALHAAEQASEMLAPIRDKRPFFYSTVLNTLALVYDRMDRDEDAERTFLLALEFSNRVAGTMSGETIIVSVNLANFYADHDRFDEAEALIEKAIARQREYKLEATEDYAGAHAALAWLRYSQQRYDEARQTAERALELSRAIYGDEDVRIARLLSLLAKIDLQKRDFKAALATLDRQQRMLSSYSTRVLPTLPESDQVSFWSGTSGKNLIQAISAAWRMNQAGVAASDQAAEWTLNGKGTLAESLAQQARIARSARDPHTAHLAEQLLDVRRQIAQLSRLPELSNAQTATMNELVAKEATLATSLGRADVVQRGARPWYDLADLRKSIPSQTVFVDFMKTLIIPESPAAKVSFDDWVYLAVVVPAAGEGEVRLINLGKAAPIEQAVRRTRVAAHDVKAVAEQGDAKAEQVYFAAAKQLSQLVVEPLHGAIAKANHLILSPDQDLWLVPWAALPDGESKFLIERAPISFVLSGRDLARKQGGRVSGNPALVVADPDFDLDPETARSVTKQLQAEGEAPLLVARRAAAEGPLRWNRLQGTSRELDWILPSLSRMTGEDPQLLVRSEALEGVVKDLWRPRIAVFATHGFFQGAEKQLFERDKVIETSQPMFVNPMLRCGLVFAGANQPGKSPDDEDGILTGMEILGLDLEGTELVVLSACETGVGEAQLGNGVAGLRQAFQLAGARSVLSTLWQVPDLATAELMDSFFLHLAEGKDKAAALREAQLAKIEKLRQDKSAAHPFYWAAFTLTGNWQVVEASDPQQRPEPAKFSVIVAAGSAPVKQGTQIMAQVRRGQPLTVHKTKGEWYWVSRPDEEPIGWIQASAVRIAPADR
ncbi:MAG: CHAT domain-containing protein, partial [Planctomycetales bacterium]|nr:CHAT domain-containing protein [Planctomycetales bacterium]